MVVIKVEGVGEDEVDIKGEALIKMTDSEDHEAATHHLGHTLSVPNTPTDKFADLRIGALPKLKSMRTNEKEVWTGPDHAPANGVDVVAIA